MHVTALLFSVLVATAVASGPTINSPSGQIQGTVDPCGLFCRYYSFRGIPYAEPPVGNLRFRNPVAHRGWSGIRDGSKHGSICVQVDMNILGSAGDEDCLYLNVYTQELIGVRPVLVVIHGGGYSTGMSNDQIYGPQKLVQEGIVLVSINYRLGALGFLSTGDEYAQGNWGLKDCIEALRWVQKNIVAFGGDPNNVTIFGNSVGGVLVHLMYLSEMADGLFHRAIAHSGTALSTFAFQTNPRFYADRMAQSFGFSSNSAEYVEQLRNVPALSFIERQEGLIDIPLPRLLRPLDFSPCVEPLASPEPKALTNSPMNLLRSRRRNVPLMVGYNDLDGAFFTAQELSIDPNLWDHFNLNPRLLVPFFWNTAEGSPASTAISAAFKENYFHSQPIGPSVDFEWAQYYGDHMILFPSDVTVREHAAYAPTYYYQFSYDGDLNLFKQSLGLTHPGAIHQDEFSYVFEFAAQLGIVIPAGSHALTVSRRFVRLFGNFVKYGNPTPSVDPLLQNVIWPNIQTQGSSEVTVLDLGENLVVTDATGFSRLQLWHDLQEKYAVNPFL